MLSEPTKMPTKRITRIHSPDSVDDKKLVKKKKIYIYIYIYSGLRRGIWTTDCMSENVVRHTQPRWQRGCILTFLWLAPGRQFDTFSANQDRLTTPQSIGYARSYPLRELNLEHSLSLL